MNLREFYEKNGVPEDDRIPLEKDVVLTIPDPDYDITDALKTLGLSEYEVAKVWPKQSVNMLAEISAMRAKLVVQVGKKFSKKFRFLDDGVPSLNGSLPDAFVNLHHHDEFSFKDGLGTVTQAIELLQAQRRSFCCVTNHGSVSGWVKQYTECRAAGIKPIFGMESYVEQYRGDDPEERKLHRKHRHLILLARTTEGFYNIIKLHNDAQLEGFYYSPRMTWESAKQWGNGVIGTSACMAGEISTLLMEDQKDEAKRVAEIYADAFDEFFIELHLIGYEPQKEANRRLIGLAREVGLPLILACDSHYLEPGQDVTHDLLLYAKQGKTVLDAADGEEDVWGFDARNLFYRDAVQMRDIFEEGFWTKEGTAVDPFKDEVFTEDVFLEAMRNTHRVAVEVEDIQLDSEVKLPVLYEDGKTIFRNKINEGFRRRKLSKMPNKKVYLDRVRHEFEVITNLGWTDYFLVMEKIVSYAVEEFGEWAIGYGRGSAAGCLVSYCLGLTGVDPIEHGLLFERFLTEDRVSPPDIDTDFDPRIRDMVKEHIVEQFGEEHTCSIGTYTKYRTKAVILDMARTLGHDVHEANQVTKKLEPLKSFDTEGGDEEVVDKMDFDEICRHYPELKEYFDNYPDVRQHAEIARNQVRNMGKHAGGVIISDVNLKDRIPVIRDKAGQIVSAWAESGNVEELSEVGLVKFDILGLNNLPVISDCLDLVEETTGERFARDQVPIDDRESIRKCSRSDMVGIFQFENPAVKPIVDAVGMESLDDVSAITSLLRPGPKDMGMDDLYAKRKHGEPYEMPGFLKDVMKDTYGVLTYQEQAQKISQVLAGFSPSESDYLRKAIGKKIPELMAKLKDQFFVGSQGRIQAGEITETEVSKMWDLIEAHAGYSFNKSLTVNAKVVTMRGVRELCDVLVGDCVRCWNERDFEWTEVVAIHDHGMLPGYEVMFEDGSQEVCTLNHKFLTREGQKPLWEILCNDLEVICGQATRKSIEGLEVFDLQECVQDKEVVGISQKRERAQAVEVEGVCLCGLRDEGQREEENRESSGSLSEGKGGSRGQQIDSSERGECSEKGQACIEGNARAIGCHGSEGGSESRGSEDSFRDNEGTLARRGVSEEGRRNLFGDSEEDIGQARDTETKVGEVGQVAEGESREDGGDNSEGTGISKAFTRGRGSELDFGTDGLCSSGENFDGKREIPKSGFSQKGCLDRSGWNLAFWVKQRKEIQRIRPRVRTQKGFDGKSGGRYRKEDVDSSWPSVLGVWKEKQEVEGRMEDFVGKALGESNTGSLAFRKVLSARFVGWRPMLDLEVRHRAHNFQLASGVITSNSHAVGYSAITTVELWLKFHYPMQFITALLNNTKLGKKKHGSDVLAGYVNYARKRGMKVGLPNVNSSGVGFSTDGKQIWFSVGHVKNVASSSGVVVAGQPYTDMADFFERTTIEVAVKTGKNKGKMRKTKLRKPVVDSLIAAGAFSDFGNRNEVSAEYYALRKKKDEEVPQCSDEGWVKKETEMLGLCLSVPPLLITAADFIRSKNLVTIGEHAEKGKKIWLFGRVADIRPHTSKAGNKMYIVTITDDVDTMNFFVFEGGKEQFRERVRKGFIVAVPMSQFDDSDTRFYDDNRMPEVVEL